MSKIKVNRLENTATADGGIDIDSSGKVGIGTAAPAHNLDISPASGAAELKIAGAEGQEASIRLYADQGDDAADIKKLLTDTSGNFKIQHYSGSAFVDSMVIDSSGNVGIGDSSPGGKLDIGFNSSSVVGLVLSNAGTGTSARFYSGSSIVGSITVTSSATAFNTSSDYRLKENVVNIADGITRVKQLLPKRFNFIVNADTTVDGFLAHEAQTVVPEAVTGQKDATREEEYEVTPAVEEVVDEEGNVTTAAVDAVMGTRIVPDYQGIDQSKLVPLLTAALQEAISKIETLETKVAALEAAE